MFFDVATLATEKQEETKHARVEWLSALETARMSLKFTQISFESLEHIARASRSPDKFTSVTRLIYQYGKTHANGRDISELIVEFTNDSPFSLTDWIDAIDYLYKWLLGKNRKADFLMMLKYLQCCVASPEAQEGGQAFGALLEDMLNVHGYDG